jgi:hypothetical protein
MLNNKHRITTGLVITLSLLLASPLFSTPHQIIYAATGLDSITVMESSASHSFAQQATFTLRAASDADVTRVYLFFRAVGEEQTESVDIGVEPASEINISHVHDLRFSPLSPFATVDFWWQIENANGEKLTTDHQQFEYIDNRFQWERLGADGIAIFWIVGHGDAAFGQSALDIARNSVQEINTELRAPVPESIRIYIYDAQHNLDAAMVLAGREWATGQAHPDLGVIVIAIPPEEAYASRMKRYIPHEITHLLVYQAVTPAGYGYVPEWLDEGLATANEQLPNPDHAVAIEQARAQGRLIPLDNLCVPFSPDSQTAFLSYAQSGSVVRFIRQQYGAQEIRELLKVYAEGASCAKGVQDVLGTSLNGLETAWLTSLEPQAPWRAWIDQIGVWAGLWLLSLLVALPMIGSRLLRQRE